MLVGVNRFTDGDDGEADILYIGPEVEELPAQAPGRRASRAATIAAVEARTLGQVRADDGRATPTLMPAMLDAVGAQATVGEIVATLEGVFGTVGRDGPGLSRWVAEKAAQRRWCRAVPRQGDHQAQAQDHGGHGR